MCESSWFRLIGAEGLGQVDFALISVLQANGVMRQRDAARAAGIEPRNIPGSVDKLRSRGLIETRSQPQDKRVKLLSLSNAGVDLLTRLGASLRQESESFLHPLDERERLVLTDLLWKIYAHRISTTEILLPGFGLSPSYWSPWAATGT
jgi:MarR family transcriptional regulator, lower aerobic nicotinate degradation pathway regulator